MADLKKLALFKFIYLKITRLKFSSRYRQAIRELRASLKQKMTEKDFSKLMKNNRYVQKGKRVLLSKSFEIPNFPKDTPSSIKQPTSPKGPQSPTKKEFIKLLKKDVIEQATKKEMDYDLFKTLREQSASFSGSSADDFKDSFKENASKTKEKEEKIEENEEIHRRRTIRLSSLPPMMPKIHQETQEIEILPVVKLKSPITIRESIESKSRLKEEEIMPEIPNETEDPRPLLKIMPSLPDLLFLEEEPPKKTTAKQNFTGTSF